MSDPTYNAEAIAAKPEWDSEFAALVRDGLAKARTKHGDMLGFHEAYAVILEELDEFWDEVKRQEFDREAALKELVHVGAMVQRAAEDLGLTAIASHHEGETGP